MKVRETCFHSLDQPQTRIKYQFRHCPHIHWHGQRRLIVFSNQQECQERVKRTDLVTSEVFATWYLEHFSPLQCSIKLILMA